MDDSETSTFLNRHKIMVALATVALLSVPFRLDFKPTKSKIKLGESVTFTAVAKNTSKQDIAMVYQIDGCHEGMRQPVIQIQIKNRDGQFTIPHVMRCGNTNPITQADFAVLKPGNTVDILRGMGWSSYILGQSLKAPGTYEFRLVVDMTAPIERWIGGPLPSPSAEEAAKVIQPMWNLVPEVRDVSDTVKLTISP
jgi:hypothetical protein